MRNEPGKTYFHGGLNSTFSPLLQLLPTKATLNIRLVTRGGGYMNILTLKYCFDFAYGTEVVSLVRGLAFHRTVGKI